MQNCHTYIMRDQVRDRVASIMAHNLKDWGKHHVQPLDVLVITALTMIGLFAFSTAM
jgi:hypothetical protein